MPPLPISLADICTRRELADKLGVDNKALDLVTLSSTPCKNDGCNLSAAANNYNQCVLCTQRWFPREFNSNGSKNNYRRGYGLYGRQFMRIYNGSSPPSTCSCDSELCQKIGYCHDGMFCFPTDEQKCQQAIRVLGIQWGDKKEAIINDPRHHYIAPWHLHRHHLTKNSDGRWATRNMEVYVDTDGKKFDFAPPNGNVQQFIDEVILPMGHDTCRGGYDILPPWVSELAAQQQQQQTAAAAGTTNKRDGPPLVCGGNPPPAAAYGDDAVHALLELKNGRLSNQHDSVKLLSTTSSSSSDDNKKKKARSGREYSDKSERGRGQEEDRLGHRRGQNAIGSKKKKPKPMGKKTSQKTFQRESYRYSTSSEEEEDNKRRKKKKLMKKQKDSCIVINSSGDEEEEKASRKPGRNKKRKMRADKENEDKHHSKQLNETAQKIQTLLAQAIELE